jgi:hypothetical protein
MLALKTRTKERTFFLRRFEAMTAAASLASEDRRALAVSAFLTASTASKMRSTRGTNFLGI